MKFGLSLLCVIALLAVGSAALGPLRPRSLSLIQQKWVNETVRKDVNGWIWLRVGGDAYKRGFQHGYAIAPEWKDAYETFVYMTPQTLGMTYEFFAKKAIELHKPLIPTEYMQEMQGITDGLVAAGVVGIALDDVVAWTGYMELTGYWWPTVRDQYSSAPVPRTKFSFAHCSGFVATGTATKDGRPVIGHESFTEFWNGQYFNLILDITPTNGARMVFQSSPGWISSMTDFWIASSGIMVVETTIAGYAGYDVTKIPEYVRARNATQYAKSIEEWVSIMEAGNNGGYANSWLLADTKSGEIAEYEQGLRYQMLDKKTDGFIFGDNVANDPRIRNLECFDTGYSDVRQQTGARRTRWPALLAQHLGKIDADAGKVMLADTYDVYLKKENPSSRTICSHYDVDPQFYASDPNAVWNVPFYPAGSVDGKVAQASDLDTMSMWGIFGRADGVAFDVDSFLMEHPQWAWQSPYLKSRPSQPYTFFNGSQPFGEDF